jgi:CDP-glycerol glycerophosphotransferase (TagB/SpsB family)/glycosyltransferase involved in cell wall biosynthesis
MARNRGARGYAKAYKRPIDANQVFYESFSGNGMQCNPEAIFRYLLNAADMQHLHHVWALDDITKWAETMAAFATHPRVRFVEVKSPEYLHELATSKYLVNNATFPLEFAKRKGQVYLNTWHGVPLKKMGYDTEGGPTITRNILRNMVSADYVLSANEFMTDRLYRQAFRMQGVYRGAVIEEGQPRTDLQFVAQRDPEPVVAELERHNLAVNDRKVILYAPTWRGQSFQTPEVNSHELVSVVRMLQATVDKERYVVLLKVHQIIYDAIRGSGEGREVLVPNDIPTNRVLGVTDILVTDYSSILFDFLPTGRPLLHHVPDVREYTSGRGLYLDESELFGPVSHTFDELSENIRAAISGPGTADDLARKNAITTYSPHEDGRVTERVVDVVFRRTDRASYRVRRDLISDNPTMLIYVGGLTSHGLTSSALNLLRNLDYERFDVSVIYHAARDRDRLKNQRLIDSRCRHFVRTGTFIATPWTVRTEQKRIEEGLRGHLPEHHRAFWRTEWRRVFGDARFDYALDLSGYGASIPFLFVNGEIGKRAIWLHNDLMADSERETNGVKHLRRRLNAVFSTFGYFDRLVSVSAELNEVNSQKLARYADPEKFTYASNTLDCDRVLKMAGRSNVARSEPEATLASRVAAFDTGNVASAVGTLLQYFDTAAVLAEVRSHIKVPWVSSKSIKTFVNVARLSPEKNHARLIRAFAKVREHSSETRLVIVGSGGLERELKELAKTLGVRDYVTFAGHVENPFAIMAKADCFVLSSDYEGQPMVVLEARTLGLPIISTRFDSVEGSVPHQAGLVVEQSDDALAEGMQRFLAGKVTCEPFDCAAYNAYAMKQFYAAIGANAAPGSSPRASAVGGAARSS